MFQWLTAVQIFIYTTRLRLQNVRLLMTSVYPLGISHHIARPGEHKVASSEKGKE